MELDRANAHLAGCAACQAEAHELRQLKRELRAMGELDLRGRGDQQAARDDRPGGPGARQPGGTG